jgi:hypothetical protein
MPFVETINLANVQSQTTSWLWEPYIPLGSVTVLLGDGGIGKSFLSLAIAAALTNATPLPGNAAQPAADVIVQNAENPLSTVVKPRLKLLAHRPVGHSDKLAEAEVFLQEVLSGGEAAADIFAWAEENGISEKTLKCAKRNAGVKSVRMDDHWLWSL